MVFSGGKMRVQFELSQEKLGELEQLMAETGIGTKAELITNALTLLKWAVKERQNGNIVASIDEHSDKYKELLMPVLEASHRHRLESYHGRDAESASIHTLPEREGEAPIQDKPTALRKRKPSEK
jgi:hypothetical protein